MKNFLVGDVDEEASSEKLIEQIVKTDKQILFFVEDHDFNSEDYLQQLSHKELYDRLQILITYLIHIVDKDIIH